MSLPRNGLPILQERHEGRIVGEEKVEGKEIGAIDLDEPLDLELAGGDPHGFPGATEAEGFQPGAGPIEMLAWEQEIHVLGGARRRVDRDGEATRERVRDRGRVEAEDDAARLRGSAQDRADLEALGPEP